VEVPAGFIAYPAEYLTLRGADAVDFLHRLSTNDILQIPGRQAAFTVLTNEKGRIIDRVAAVRLNDCILLQTSAAAAVRQWLEKYIIMDDVQIHDSSGEYTCFLVVAAGPPLFQGMQIGLRVTDSLWPVSTLRLIAQAQESRSVEDELSRGYIQMTSDEYEALRIECGVPVYGRELTGMVNPLEAGLADDVSFTKGCYIGQEVIARLDTYHKVQKKLMGIIFDERPELPPQNGLLVQNDEEIGWVTSLTRSRRVGKTIGLGYVKTATAEALALYVAGSVTIPVTITSLPIQ
jgi:folate-binding protein YgfZ